MNTVPMTALPPKEDGSKSHIAAYGYDAATETLAIEFTGGRTYHYAAVPLDVYESLLMAESFGKFLHAHIKGIFVCTQIQNEKAE